LSSTLSHSQQAFYIHGFLAALRSYRRTTIIGWTVAAAGALSVPVGWSMPSTHGTLDLALSCLTVIAGVVLVTQSLSMLERYVTTPFGADEKIGNPEVSPDAIFLIGIMHDVENGGWEDAIAAIRKVEDFAGKDDSGIVTLATKD
jgi:hypothetical protein